MRTSETDLVRRAGDDAAPLGIPELGPNARATVDLARSSARAMSLQEQRRGLARVQARLARGPGVRLSSRGATTLVLGLAAALLCAGWIGLRPPRSPVLAYTVDGAPAAREEPLVTGAGDLRAIQFSDGTEVELGERASLRLTALTEHGARLSLDRGELRVRVVHWSGSRWLFDAGPFLVKVTGTTFRVSWSPDEQRFDLKLESGAVAVSGVASDEPIALHGGQWLTIRTRPREILIRDLVPSDDLTHPPASGIDADASSEDVPDGGDALPPEAVEGPDAPPLPERTASSNHPPSPPRPPRDWAGELAAGKLDDIMDDARAWGIDACLAEASSAELSALADAARYSRNAAVAKRALLAQRRRFPRSARAAEAAFLLGRLAEAGEGGAAALAWFEKYLSEASSGAYAAEALGRKMILVQRLSGDAQATPVAREYLRRFPSGAYARAAHDLEETP